MSFAKFKVLAMQTVAAMSVIVCLTGCIKVETNISPSEDAFLYVHYFGEQAKPFPFLILTPTKGRETTNLQQILARYSVTARRYIVSRQKFFDIWQFLIKEYNWQDLPVSSPVGDDLFEIVLWDQIPKQTLMDRQKTRTLLQHILTVEGGLDSRLTNEIETLIRRLSN
ncbi:MAG: hypothetical protein KME21_31670 [Desmonostoc vinosum HA7617-LM4]|nr:hypothetical protein [Desmonostoc vinosum HA7617-LM4]